MEAKISGQATSATTTASTITTQDVTRSRFCPSSWSQQKERVSCAEAEGNSDSSAMTGFLVKRGGRSRTRGTGVRRPSGRDYGWSRSAGGITDAPGSAGGGEIAADDGRADRARILDSLCIVRSHLRSLPRPDLLRHAAPVRRRRKCYL